MENTFFGIGIACIIAAIIGGGLKAFGMEIPLVNSVRRQLLLGLFGAVLAMFAAGAGHDGPSAPSAQLQQGGDSIIGTWRQLGYVPETSEWKYLGTFDVAKTNGNYTISAREQQEAPNVLNSIGIFDVQSDGTSLRFNSNWGEGKVGNFDLHRTSPTVFEGTVSVENQVVGRTKFVRVL